MIMAGASWYTVTPATTVVVVVVVVVVAAAVAAVDDVIATSNTIIVNEKGKRNNKNNNDELELDFPEEKVKDLLVELYQLFATYLCNVWTTLMNLVKEKRIDVSTQLFDGYRSGANSTLHYSKLFGEFLLKQIPDTWKEQYHNIYDYVCEKENYYWFQLLMEGEMKAVFQMMKVKINYGCIQIGNQLIQFPSMIHELYQTYYQNQSKWVKGIILLVMCYGLYKVSIGVRRWYKRRQKRLKKKNRRVRMKKAGHSEIVHGRTSLYYGAAGELREEEYLEDSSESDSEEDSNNQGQLQGPSSGQAGRGRFGTFDFFGMHGPTKPLPKKTNTASNRKRNQSSWDDPQDHMFGVALRRSSSLGGRSRTNSTDSMGAMIRQGEGRARSKSTDSLSAMIRSRTDSTNSVSDTISNTFGGFFQSFRVAADGGKAPPLPSVEVNNKTVSFKNTNTTRKKKRMNQNQNTRLRKERLGSMDIFYAPGKSQPALKAGQCNALGQKDRDGINRDTSRKNTDYTSSTCNRSVSYGNNYHRPLGSGVGNGFKSVNAEPHFQGGYGYDNDIMNDDDDDYSHDDCHYDTTTNENYNDEAATTQYLYDEFGVVTLSHRVEYHGPFQPLLQCGSTLIKPVSYEIASHRITYEPEIELPLHRVIQIDLLQGLVNVIEPTTTLSQNQKWDLSYAVNSISIKFHSIDGGVMSIYPKENEKEAEEKAAAPAPAAGAKEEKESGWKEHTFESTHVAAQFQLDLLAYQVVGKPLLHIFESLNLVHQGSLAYPGQEFVLHDTVRGGGSNNDGKSGEGKEDNNNNTGDTTGADANNNKRQKPIEATQCVAWDDAMRAMSSIPTVRIALERLWLSHRRPSEISSSFEEKDKKKSSSDNDGGGGGGEYNESVVKKDDNKKDNRENNATTDKAKMAILENDKVSDAELSLLKEEYTKNRLLLGPVDFYRLFVPTLPETAIPEGDANNRGRMEQLLCWRKRVARASVLVRSYTRARLVANRGWKLDQNDHSGGESSITKRFAYDGNENNYVRDTTAKNEIYEASVSRDVLCHVRPFDYLVDVPNDENDEDHDGRDDYENDNDNDSGIDNEGGDHHQPHQQQQKRDLVLSPYQAYNYVGSHYFNASDEMLKEGGPLHPARDPVDMFPSLKGIITRYPDLDFFFMCISSPDDNIMIVHLHVRSLAKCIDPQFDNVIERFSKCSEETRKRKLYLMCQVGNSIGLSFLGWLFLRLILIYLRLTETGRNSQMNLESTRERYGFPGFRVGGIFNTYHFGGSLVGTDPSKPTNYLGLTTSVVSSYYEKSYMALILFNKLKRYIGQSTVDFTYVIQGERNDELPERALSTLRIAHVNAEKVAIDPSSYLAMVSESDGDDFLAIESHTGIDTTPSSTKKALHAIEHVVEDAVQFSLQSMQSIAVLGASTLPAVLSPKKKKIAEDGRLGVIMEGNEMGIEPIVDGHLERAHSNNDIDPLEQAIDWVVDILRTVMIPSRHLIAENFDPNSSKKLEEIEETGIVIMKPIPVLRMFDRNDIGRFIRNNDFEIKVAAEKLVTTAVWRGRTFPIDKRRCRIELQNGQFFQQGYDFSGNPVYYFRNLCRGPWRGNEEATILATLYRLDKSLNELRRTNPNTKVTLIILMGHSKRKAKKKKKATRRESKTKDDDTAAAKENNKDANDDDASDNYELADDDDAVSAASSEALPSRVTNKLEIPVGGERKINTGNPRISPDEKWTLHTSKDIIRHLSEILLQHYPGLLSKILIVKGQGKNHYYTEQLQGRRILKKLLKNKYSQVTDKLQFVKKTSELTPYVPVKDLLAIVGGAASIDETAYEFH